MSPETQRMGDAGMVNETNKPQVQTFGDKAPMPAVESEVPSKPQAQDFSKPAPSLHTPAPASALSAPVETEPLIPASPMIDMAISSIEGMLESMPAPKYVKTSGEYFVGALKRWALESEQLKGK